MIAEDPASCVRQRRLQRRRQPSVRQNGWVTAAIARHDRPARRLHPGVRLLDQPLGHPFGVEGGIRLADGLEDGFAALQTGAQRPQSSLETSGEIGSPGGRADGHSGTLRGDRYHRSRGGSVMVPKWAKLVENAPNLTMASTAP